MSPLPRAVEAAGAAALARKRDPTTIGPDDFFVESDRVRSLFARLIGGSAERVALIPAVSYGVATVARNAPARAGQNIVIASGQFPSNVYGWRRLCAERALELRVVTPPASARPGEAWNAALLEAVDAATAVVALPHVHWTDGTRYDLDAIGARVHAAGGWLVVDGTQSVGALDFDVQRIRPDALICAGYKWLLGPYGLGVAHYGARLDTGVPLEETWIARSGSEDFRGLVDYRDEYQPGAARYDVGERSSFVLVPMLATALELVLDWRPARIQAYCAQLLGNVLAEAETLGYRVESPDWRAAHLVGIRLPAGHDAARIEAALRQRDIHASLRGSALRLSPYLYNDDVDAVALLDALRAAALETGRRAVS
jgi:selenocysteine lyase/cysteine desulfurase